MWLATGVSLVNLDLISRVEVSRESGNRWVLCAHSFGGESSWRIFAGNEAECRQYLRVLERLLGATCVAEEEEEE